MKSIHLNRFALLILATASLSYSVHDPYSSGVVRDHISEWLSVPRAHHDDVEYSHATIAALLDSEAPILALYRHGATHRMVGEFFVALTGSTEIAHVIMYHADRQDVPLSLAFSVAWVESRFKPNARNFNVSSFDSGLFQLNSRSFFRLSDEDFFNPEINARHASDYLRYCLRTARGDPATALGIYNAGLGRVRSGTIPASTRRYIQRVLSYRAQLIERFRTYVINNAPDDEDDGNSAAGSSPVPHGAPVRIARSW